MSRIVGLVSALEADMTRHEREKKWGAWLRRNRDELVACGMPQSLLEHEDAWHHFLTFGYSTHSTVRVDDMEAAQAERLCIFLEREGYDCYTLGRLQIRFKRGRYASKEW